MTTQHSVVPHHTQSHCGTRGMSHRITPILTGSSEQLSASMSTKKFSRMLSNGNLQARFQTRHVTSPFARRVWQDLGFQTPRRAGLRGINYRIKEYTASWRYSIWRMGLLALVNCHWWVVTRGRFSPLSSGLG